ncbi:hypothetical protein PAXRUDRAFT_560814 [Paxillus rubicundulus Ve08.2h10]|uniref:Uncharacterized protein n=1 Tax=Paxillus rubicundulus Ve08.2h10 TaxID=930991 RepID=A0A0D0BRM8_9AGAM|nr:hypothetical protein PAXRUDRAFT_560814 [Paxillus rubicundulus Ve08.2h10]
MLGTAFSSNVAVRYLSPANTKCGYTLAPALSKLLMLFLPLVHRHQCSQQHPRSHVVITITRLPLHPTRTFLNTFDKPFPTPFVLYSHITTCTLLSSLTPSLASKMTSCHISILPTLFILSSHLQHIVIVFSYILFSIQDASRHISPLFFCSLLPPPAHCCHLLLCPF